MKKFLLWQISMICLLAFVYTVYISMGTNQNNAVFYSMVGVGLGTVAYALFWKVKFTPTLEVGAEFEKGGTVIAAIIIAFLCLGVASLCGASLVTDFVTFALTFLITVAIPVEVSLTVVALIIIFSTAFGASFPAALVILALAIFWGMALRSQGLIIRKELIFFSAGLQAILSYIIFTHGSGFFVLKVLS